MENMRWILLLAGIGIILGIFLLTWLPRKLKDARHCDAAACGHQCVRVRFAVPDEAGISVDGMVESGAGKTRSTGR